MDFFFFLVLTRSIVDLPLDTVKGTAFSEPWILGLRIYIPGLDVETDADKNFPGWSDRMVVSIAVRGFVWYFGMIPLSRIADLNAETLEPDFYSLYRSLSTTLTKSVGIVYCLQTAWFGKF